jgi:formylglycine-generating enzyme required for sulfatase activity
MKTFNRHFQHHFDTSKLVAASLPLLVALLTGCGDDAQSPAGTGGDAGSGGDGATGGAGGSGNAGSGGSAGSTPFSCPGSQSSGEMVAVAEGEFLMGCNETLDTECESDEMPGHAVFVSAFEIDKTEVTQEQFAACVHADACAPPSGEWDCNAPTLPASFVNRDQAMDYCEWAGKRLPTEAEWEKAARGTDGRKFPWGNQAPDCTLSNMEGCAGKPDPTGSHPTGASPYGALDMAGNMVEIISDWYDPAYYSNAPTSDPQGPANGERFVGRGGGWKSDAFWHRASVRDWYDLEDAGTSFGFRCAR